MRLSRLIAVVVTAAAMAGLVAASHAPLTPHVPGGAVLRLAWSARPERIEQCQAQSAEELARLPPHMRQAVVCEGVAAHYRLTATVDGRVLADRLVTAGGLRHDRRLYVLEEIPIAAGEAAVDVRFERIDSQPQTAAPSPSPGPADGRERRGDGVPARLVFTERRHIKPDTVLLVTYDSTRRELTAKAPFN